MTRPRSLAMLLASALLALAPTACRDHDAAAPRSGADMPAAGHDVPLPAGRASPLPSPDPTFDATTFAGTFQAGGTTVELRPDGRYRLRAREAQAGGDATSDGLWSLETGTGQLLLVPHAADEPRRRYSMPSADELVPEGGGPPLRRMATPAAG